MAPEIRKTAERYVKEQIGGFSKKIAPKDVKEAIRKVAEALEEVQTARAAAAARAKIDLR